MTENEKNARFDTFLAQNNNQYIEWVDPSPLAKNQCVDVIAKWIENGLSLPRLTNGIGSAYQLWNPSTTLLLQYFDRIQNSLTFIPKKGDICIWGSSYNNGDGHTGVATGNGNLINFDCLEQNDPLYSNTHIRNYNYLQGFIGVLRLKTTDPVIDPMLQKKASGFDRVWNPFKYNGKTAEQAEEKDHIGFVAWIQSNVARAGASDKIRDLVDPKIDITKISAEDFIKLVVKKYGSGVDKIKLLELVEKLKLLAQAN